MNTNLSNSFSYIRGTQIVQPYPLSRYLPPIPAGVATEWLNKNTPGKGVILDPFGSSPNLIIEIANAGYPVIVAANNPITRFLIELAANPPEQSQLKSALAELASASKGNERIEPFIRSLYSTDCPQCGRSIEADAFLWEKGAQTPYGRIIHCPYCGENGERPATQSDIENAVRFSNSTLHHARALERIAPPNHPDRIHAEEAISVYLPRSLYALFTLVNKLDALDLPAERKKHIDALLLTAFDQSNSLWGYQTSRERPKSLSLPNRFKENNIWLSLEKSIDLWVKDLSGSNITLSTWPSTAVNQNTIYLFDGRLRELVDDLKDHKVNAVVSAIPRPNQAFWSLSALWAGWLWGRESIGPFINVLKRRRYDWNWHTTALYAAYKHLSNVLEDKTAMFGIIGEAEIGYITASLVAANNAGFRLVGLAPRYESGQAQMMWKHSREIPKYYSENSLRKLVLDSGREFVKERGQPASYLRMNTSSLTGIYQGQVIKHPIGNKQNEVTSEEDSKNSSSTSPSQDYSYIQSLVRGVLANPVYFRRYKDSESIESGYWGIKEDLAYQTPQFDRVEKIVVETLVRERRCSIEELDRLTCEAFPGLYTPPEELIQICLESYAMQLSSDDLYWQLREEDIPGNREIDIKNIHEQLLLLGSKLGFTIITKTDQGNRQIISWSDKGKEIYSFFPIASAIIGDIILNSQIKSDNPIIVLPGGRANLIAYKINRDPRLGEKIKIDSESTGEWRFLKFRHLRWILENPLLISNNFNEQLDLDPLTFTTPQLRLL